MGTLIHPQIAVTSGPCGQNHDRIIFGETVDSPAAEYEVSYCRRNPNYTMGVGTNPSPNSLSYCVLTEPALDVPIVPVAMGCETGVIAAGMGVVTVGYGATTMGGATGTKSAVDGSVATVLGTNVLHSPGTCLGDSGAPSFLQLPTDQGADGTWRLISVADDTPDCSGMTVNTASTLVHTSIAWIEEDLAGQVDLTPCHDADGTWNPGPECQMFPLDPAASAGAWADGCDGGPLFDGYQALCGDPYDPPPGTEETGTDGGDDGGGDAETTDGGGSGATEDGAPADGDDGGGGGCSVASADDSGGASAGLALLALLGLGRRRRR
jgi:MYXO-CTERM domain-containing protein